MPVTLSAAPQRHAHPLYAVDRLLDLPEGVPSDQVYSAMEGSIISSVELTGTYAR